MSVNMETTFAGVTFKNPVSTCSGTYGFGIEYGRFVPVERLGSITTKGLRRILRRQRRCAHYGNAGWYAQLHRAGKSRR